MGGNGYYCNVAFRHDEPWVLECRKFGHGVESVGGAARRTLHGDERTEGRSAGALEGGRHKRSWVSDLSAKGFAASMPFRRMPDSYEPSLSWVMEGIEREIFGDFGLAYDGAAGLELDAYDLKLGTPPNTKLLAASGGHDDNYIW